MWILWAGDSLGVFVVSPLKVRPEQRAMPSTAWLMPSTRFWEPDEVLVITEHRNYTVSDYKQLFMDINYTDGYLLWQDTKDLIGGELIQLKQLTTCEIPVCEAQRELQLQLENFIVQGLHFRFSQKPV